MLDFWTGFINALTNNQPGLTIPVVIGLAVTVGIVWHYGGRAWAIFYVAVIPFLNWSFGVVPNIEIAEPGVWNEKGISLHPLTLVTGFVFVARDFVQREMGHKVLIVMALAIGWAFFYAHPVIVIASGTAFAVSEMVDWAFFTFTNYKLSTRILISSALATPVDTTIFLYGAGLASKIAREEERAGIIAELGANSGPALEAALADLPPLEVADQLHLANWIVFVIGKMVGALIVSRMIKKREEAGFYDDENLETASA